MIVRVFRVRVDAARVDEFARFFRDTALPLIESQPGIVAVTAGLPRDETPTEFCMVMVWESVDALRAFAGEDWRRPHVHPDEEGLVLERHLYHYTAVAH